MPVLACLGADAEGHVYNINADIVANRVAIALDAKALVLVSDVPGVLRDITDPGSRIARLSVAEGRKAIADGVVTKGMIPKLEESFAALAEGVRACTSSASCSADSWRARSPSRGAWERCWWRSAPLLSS